jgi:hypothetical protein
MIGIIIAAYLDTPLFQDFVYKCLSPLTTISASVLQIYLLKMYPMAVYLTSYIIGIPCSISLIEREILDSPEHFKFPEK